MLAVVSSGDPPLRVFFGETPLAIAIATADYECRLEPGNEWQPLAVAAHGGRG